MSNDQIRKLMWWVCLIAAPVVLIGLELFHPAHFTAAPGMFQYLCKAEPYDPQFLALAYPGPHWWFMLHLIQTPLVAFVTLGLWLLTRRIDDSHGTLPVLFAWVSRAAALVFLVYYTALDSIGGTGLGRLLQNTQALIDAGKLTPEQVDGIALLLNTTWVDPWVGGVGSFISLTGSWAIFAAMVFAGAGLLLARRAPVLPVILLVAFGWELQTSHTMPHGPLAFAMLIVAALWLWWDDRRAAKPIAAVVPAAA